MMSHNEPQWRVVGASVVGTSHLRNGQPCQDAFRYELLAGGVLVIAVSDGAGSAAKAADGSVLAVAAATSSLADALVTSEPSSKEAWQRVMRNAFDAARAALTKQAALEKSELRDYAATLMLVILSKKWTIGGLIGDCAAVILNQADQLVSLCRAQTGEYANMTNFLTLPDALEQLDLHIQAEPAQAVAVFSDGLSRLALNLAQNKPYAPFFKPLFAFTAAIEDEQEAQPQLEAFLNSKRINAGTNDDKTLVLASRSTASSERRAG